MIGAVTASLIAAGIAGGAGYTGERIRRRLRDQRFSTDLDPVLTSFHGALEQALLEHDDVALSGVAAHWGEIAPEIRDLDLVVEDEEAAVDRIVDCITDCEDVTLDEDTEADLRDLVCEVYGDAVESFRRTLAEEGLAGQLNADLNVRIRQELDEVRSRIEELQGAPNRRYRAYRVDEVPDLRAEVPAEESAEVEFVERPELDDRPDADKLLVVAPRGGGKTEVLHHLLPEFAAEVTHVLTPRDEALNHPRDEYAFEYVTFDGDVLLYWDDVHHSDDEHDNSVFSDFVGTLGAHLDDQGHELHVLAAARSGQIDDLPGKGIHTADQVDRATHTVWAPFSTFELEPLPGERLVTMAERLAAEFDVDTGDDAIEALVRKAAHDSAPIYLDTMFRASEGGELTPADVEDLPETAAGVWREQYDALLETEGGEDTLDVVRACKLLYDVGITTYPAPLVWGIYDRVLGGGTRSKSTFLSAVEDLRGRRWLRTAGDGRYGEDVRYAFHDTQVEAVRGHVDEFVPELSSFLLPDNGSETVLPGDMDDVELVANGQFATYLYESGDDDRAETHYRRCLDVDEEDSTTHYNYANLLAETDRPDQAEQHYRRALRLTAPPDADDPLQSDYSKAHFNYGHMLVREGRFADARSHLERSVALWEDRGVLTNALHDVRWLVVACARAGDGSAAREHAERMLALAEAVDDSALPAPERQLRLLSLVVAEQSARRLGKLYRHGLLRVVRGRETLAASILDECWRCREAEAVDETPWEGLAAGVWLVLLDEGTDADGEGDPGTPVEYLLGQSWSEDLAGTVKDAVGPELDRLTPVPTALFRTRFTDETGATPDAIRERLELDGRLAELEVRAYEALPDGYQGA